MKTVYITTKDIVIPAGTPVMRDSIKRKYAVDMASILTAETRDATSEWMMPFDEALALGLIKEIDK